MKYFPAFVLALVGTSSAAGQNSNLKSQLADISQSVMSTRIDIHYRRPVARGRELFGALVPFDRPWSPSADTAARITVSTPFEVNGTKLPAGSYSLWAIPGTVTWQMIFSKQAVVFHTRYPEGQDALRATATPHKGEHVETLEFSFPMVDADSAVLQLRWGTVVVPLKLRVVP